MQSLRGCVARPAAFKPAGRSSLKVTNAAVAQPVAVPVKGVDGSDKGTQELALRVAKGTGSGLVHRYVVMVQQNARQGTASTLTRSEVRGGGKKPYAQKGTGNARRGSNVSPLFPGGGVTFGPKPKDWTISMNKKERRLALATALQSAAGDMVVVDSLDGAVPDRKTKSMVALLEKVGVDVSSKKVLLVTAVPRPDVELAGRNLPKLTFNSAAAISVFDLLNADQVVVEKGALEHIQSFYGGKQEEQA